MHKSDKVKGESKMNFPWHRVRGACWGERQSAEMGGKDGAGGPWRKDSGPAVSDTGDGGPARQIKSAVSARKVLEALQ